jgi:2-methylcitrate dehydratase PrpD
LRGEYAGAGLWGILGAAVACGLLKGFGSEKIMQTMNVAASLTLAAPIGTSVDPAIAAIVGEASFRGVLATTLVEAGYNGLRDGVGFTFGELVGHRIDRAGLLAPRQVNTSV